MQIEYVMTRSRRTVSDAVGAALVKRRLAREVCETRAVAAEEEPQEISAVTGKPKRKYKRRDMQAEG
jgi:hypothetical protein